MPRLVSCVAIQLHSWAISEELAITFYISWLVLPWLCIENGIRRAFTDYFQLFLREIPNWGVWEGTPANLNLIQTHLRSCLNLLSLSALKFGAEAFQGSRERWNWGWVWFELHKKGGWGTIQCQKDKKQIKTITKSSCSISGHAAWSANLFCIFILPFFPLFFR